MRRGLVLILVSLALGLMPGRDWGEGALPTPAVDVALVLAVDVSSSVDEGRFHLQEAGYAAAFRNPTVQAALLSGPAHAIAVAYVQWAGARSQHVALAWTRVDSEAAARDLADRIGAIERLDEGSTSISGAIDFAMTLFQAMPYRAARRILDVSGDGSNNSGRLAYLARDDAVKAGITINGLPILTVEPELDRYYRDNVIGGPDAFMVPATGFDTFATAIAYKLEHEVAARPVKGTPPS